MSTFCSQMANKISMSRASLIDFRSAAANSLGLSKLASSAPDAERMIQGPRAGATPPPRDLRTPDLFAVVKCETKWVAKRGKRPLRRVGLGSFKGEIMCLARGRGLALARTRAFPNNLYVAGPHADPHLGGIGCGIELTTRAAPHAVAGKRPPIPGVIAEDAVGLSDDVPTLNVMKISCRWRCAS